MRQNQNGIQFSQTEGWWGAAAKKVLELEQTMNGEQRRPHQMADTKVGRLFTFLGTDFNTRDELHTGMKAHAGLTDKNVVNYLESRSAPN